MLDSKNRQPYLNTGADHLTPLPAHIFLSLENLQMCEVAQRDLNQPLSPELLIQMDTTLQVFHYRALPDIMFL
jgi:hypothetical protein